VRNREKAAFAPSDSMARFPTPKKDEGAAGAPCPIPLDVGVEA